jgi:hypothetical protein
MPAVPPQKPGLQPYETKGFSIAELHPELHEALKAGPMVKGLGLSPEVAAQWVQMGRKGGESFEQALNRFSQETGRSMRGEVAPATGGLARAGQTAATAAPRRMNQTAATVV